MSTKTIDKATSADLRGSWQALLRAAQRARELAAKTGTELVVSRNGVIQRIKPEPGSATVAFRTQERSAPGEERP